MSNTKFFNLNYIITLIVCGLIGFGLAALSTGCSKSEPIVVEIKPCYNFEITKINTDLATIESIFDTIESELVELNAKFDELHPSDGLALTELDRQAKHTNDRIVNAGNKIVQAHKSGKITEECRIELLGKINIYTEQYFDFIEKLKNRAKQLE